MEQMRYDVVVVGGGAAGLSGAVALARSRRAVLVLDGGEPRNTPAEGIHNLLGREGMAPGELLRLGRSEAEGYGAEIRAARATGAQAIDSGFSVTLDDGGTVTARRLLVATGVTDELPDLPGLARHWGHQVLHCPYCHGWEVRDQRIGVLATGAAAVHQALLFAQLSPSVTVLSHTAQFGPDDLRRLAAAGVAVHEGRVMQVLGEESMTGVRFADGSEVALDALVVMPRVAAVSTVLDDLGVPVQEHPMGFGTYYPTELGGRTAVAGVWLAGNVTDPMTTVAAASAAGVMAGAAINGELIEADLAGKLAGSPGDHADHVLWDAAFWDERYAGSDQLWSGHVNAVVAELAAQLPAGRALDIGCGEGGDALWLAENGWRTVGTDISQVALDRARARADQLGLADRTRWELHDLLAWTPPARAFDLVVAAFMHLPTRQREQVYADLVEAVAAGGSLIIAGHHPSDREVVPRPDQPDLFFSEQDLTDMLDADQWEVLVAQARPRTTTHPETGETVTVHDTVLHARRRD